MKRRAESLGIRTVSHRRIRTNRAGDHNEKTHNTAWQERALLSGLVVLGVFCFLFFADYWLTYPREGQTSVWFILLTFVVFWKPVRTLYYWWVFLWISEPRAPTREAVASTTDLRVDVVTTAMPGEPFEMLDTTLVAISQLDGLNRAFLLDGGNDPILRARCTALGIEHVNCHGIAGAKAGKINHCLSHYSTADFVTVLDPDHIPRPDFIRRVLPWFSDRQVGFVQVVQAYYNLRENWLAWAAAEQTFGFYGPTMMGLHGLGIPTAIGANCTFRRVALDSTGGHAVHLAEDALTSMRLHAGGWKSVYLPWRGSAGLVPTDLSAFWKQQLKWATGMTYLLVREYPRLFRRFSALGRLHYFVAGTHYLGGVVAALNLLLPITILFFHIAATRIPVSGFLVHWVPYLVAASLIAGFTQRWNSHREEDGFPWRSMLLEQATWHIYFLGFVYGIVDRKVPYLPTPKGGQGTVPLRLMVPHLIAIALSLSAVAWVPLTYSHIDPGTSLMMLFATVNAGLLLPVVVSSLWNRQGHAQTEIPR
jgi:cellulose synthase (UDP-forming)